MQELGRGTKVFDAAPVRGRVRVLAEPGDVIDLLDHGADGVVALVRDAGATFLAPVFHELAAVLCTSGTPRSHIGIVSREFHVPCAMGCRFDGGEPVDGTEVELDCSGEDAVVRLATGAPALAAPSAGPLPVPTVAPATAAPPAAVPPAASPAAAVAPAAPGEDAKAAVNRLIAYHSPISRALTAERTSLESQLIPVSAYIITAGVECFLRYPEMMRAIDAALPAEEIGRRARRPGCRVNTVHLWSIANMWLIGRKVWSMVDPAAADAVEPAHEVLTFWERAARTFRGGDGTLQAWDTGGATPYGPDVVEQLLAAVAPVDDPGLRDRITQFNASVVAYLFLLYFDTRVGTGDTGPYRLPDGRVLLVRDFYQMARSDFWWSDVAAEVPYENLTVAFVLDGARIDRVTDFGTTYTTPEDYLAHVVGFALCTTDGELPGRLRPLPLDEMERITAATRRAQAAHYRAVAAMDRHEKIRCGAYVYFAFLRPFAQEAGIADALDWTVPRDIPPPLYEMVSQMEGGDQPLDDPYYPLVP